MGNLRSFRRKLGDGVRAKPSPKSREKARLARLVLKTEEALQRTLAKKEESSS